jgi:hypothetical protein
MVVLDFFIVNVALPSIGTELGAGLVALVVTTRLVPVPAAADDRRR